MRCSKDTTEGDMLHQSSSNAVAGGGGGGAAGFGSEGIPANVGKVASALLAKHVRTLEVLYSLQRENANLRRDIKVKILSIVSHYMSCAFLSLNVRTLFYILELEFPYCTISTTYRII